jgi:hypothetical protein
MCVNEYRSLVATLIRDGRRFALFGLWLDALEQLPAQVALAAAEQAATGPGALAANRDFQCDVLREVFRQLSEASQSNITAEDLGTKLYQASTQDRAAAARSEILDWTERWLKIEVRAPEVRELVIGIIGELELPSM